VGAPNPADAAVFQVNLKAFYNSENGIYKGLYLLNKVSKAAATFSNDSVIVAFDSTNLTITAEGISGSVHDSIKVYLQATWPYNCRNQYDGVFRE